MNRFQQLIFQREMRVLRPGPMGILNPPLHPPILDVATGTQFVLLADLPERERVVGTIVIAPPGSQQDQRPTPEEFKRLRHPGFAVAAMNFLIEQGRDLEA